jgi:hypothetical protein
MSMFQSLVFESIAHFNVELVSIVKEFSLFKNLQVLLIIFYRYK